MSTKRSIFIGIDLSDPFAKCKRPCTRATIGTDLNCIFDEWEYDLTGNQIAPDNILPIHFVLAIDGPQGLAGNPEYTMRLGERGLGTAGKSSYAFRPIGQPYAGFVQGSVKLFYSLYRSQRFQLYGLKTEKLHTNLIEVYPGAAWPVVAGHRLQKKRLLAGRKSRYELLMGIGIKFSPKYTIEVLPTHDQLDAAIAAYIA
ncbi:unnamed protein product, partial [marine sediment metagenome]